MKPAITEEEYQTMLFDLLTAIDEAKILLREAEQNIAQQLHHYNKKRPARPS